MYRLQLRPPGRFSRVLDTDIRLGIDKLENPCVTFRCDDTILSMGLKVKRSGQVCFVTEGDANPTEAADFALQRVLTQASHSDQEDQFNIE